MDCKVGRIVFCDEYFAQWQLKWSDLRKARRHTAGSVRSPNFNLVTGTSCFSIQLKLPSPDCKITYVLKLVRLSTTYMLRPVQLRIGGIIKHYENEWFISEPRLEFKASDVTEKDTLLICCEISEVVSTEDSSIGELSLEDLSTAQRIPSPEETKVEEEDTPRSKSTAKLIGDLKDILISKKDSDVVLKVKDREFKAHRLILGMRSPVFSAMFEHEMKEKNTGVVAIEDCDQAIFPDFLHYIYTGTVELSSENAPGLYVAADKYQLLELKEECLDYMKRKFAVESFCDFLTVSLRHHERELTEIATEFFLEKAADIIVTTKWMTFLAENVVAGNELFVKFTSNKGTK